MISNAVIWRSGLSALLLLLSNFPGVSAYYGYYNSWYIYAIVAFVIIAVSSCIGACIRHQRQKAFVTRAQLQQQTIITGTTNQTYMPSTNAPAYPYAYPPASGPVSPPEYMPPSEVKDPNAPPTYADAVNAPMPVPGSQSFYPTQPAYEPPAPHVSNSSDYPPAGTAAPYYPMSTPTS